MTCSCSGSCCCSDECAEVVPVTINQNTYEIDGGALTIEVDPVVPADATKRTITATVTGAGYWRIKFWFTDYPVPDERRSLVFPDEPGAVEFERVTDATGIVTFEVENAGALRTWYLCGTLGAGVQISAAISIGV